MQNALAGKIANQQTIGPPFEASLLFSGKTNNQCRLEMQSAQFFFS